MSENILIISEHTNIDKIERHFGPLRPVGDKVTMVCLTPNKDVDLSYKVVPSYGFRYFGILLMFFVGLIESFRNDYDIIISLSLFPYGLYTIVIGKLARVPTHLGILGADLDVHARAWYGKLPQNAFRQFDSISVLGSEHRDQLIRYNVGPEKIFILTNGIDTDVYQPKSNTDVVYDFVWAGRLSVEKDPVLFINAISKLQTRGYDVRAVILGDGKLEEKMKKIIQSKELSSQIDHPGWVKEPSEYYAKSQTFVLTSKREALGLSLIESMAMGLACVAPYVGNIPDIADHERNALLVEEHNSESFADAMERLLTDDNLRENISKNAVSVGQSFSYMNAQQDWEEIVQYTTKQ